MKAFIDRDRHAYGVEPICKVMQVALSNLADVSGCEMDWTGMKLLLEGIEPKQVRKRYKKPVGG